MTDQQIFNDLFKDHIHHMRDLSLLRSKEYKEYHLKIKELLDNGTLVKDSCVAMWKIQQPKQPKK